MKIRRNIFKKRSYDIPINIPTNIYFVTKKCGESVSTFTALSFIIVF